jgi:hypothetical protein
MSLLNQTNPVDTFIQCGRQFLAAPNILNGLELDDAVVALKRHARVQLVNEELATVLEQFPPLIRNLNVSSLQLLFERVMTLLDSGQ